MTREDAVDYLCEQVNRYPLRIRDSKRALITIGGTVAETAIRAIDGIAKARDEYDDLDTREAEIERATEYAYNAIEDVIHKECK